MLVRLHCSGNASVWAPYALAWLIASSCVVGKAGAGPVDLDLNGFLGPPDTVYVSLYDTISVDAWFTWSENLFTWNLYLCESNDGLEFLDVTFHPETTFPSGPSHDSLCLGIGGAGDFPSQLLAATARYRAIATGQIELTINDATWVDQVFEDGSVTNEFGALVVVAGSTESAPSSWTDIKSLFR